MKDKENGVSGILLVGGRALVIRRSRHDTEPGCWEFIKGEVEFGETSEEAIRREYLEETGLKVQINKKIDVNSWSYSRQGLKVCVVEAVFEVKLETGEKIENIELSDDHDSWKLVDRKSTIALEPIVEVRRNYLLENLKS